MLKQSLIHRLYLYNIHIGHIEDYNTELNSYVIGRRFNFQIIDLNKSFILLKKAIFFLVNLSLNNGSLLFNHTEYHKLNLLHKCVLLSISRYSSQQMITYDWIYGLTSNYFFSFFNFIDDMSRTWVMSHKYLTNSNKDLNPYYSSLFEKDKSHLDVFKYYFLTRGKKTYISKRYSRWHERWVNKQKSARLFLFKKRALKRTNFLQQLCLNDFNMFWKKKKMLNFKYLFLKFFYYMSHKQKDPFFSHMETNETTYKHIHEQFYSYWRFLLYFKYFNNYYKLPDALFSVFPNTNDLPANEYTSHNLVSIGLVDTNCNFSNLNYPIISNDDSFLISVFYFTLFSNIFLESQINIYNSFKNSFHL